MALRWAGTTPRLQTEHSPSVLLQWDRPMSISEKRAALRRNEAAAYVAKTTGAPCSPSTLAHAASNGGGPKFFKIGPFPFYDPDDLDAWIASKTSSKVERSGDVPRKRKANRAA